MLTHITAIIYQLFELVTLTQQVFLTILQFKFLNIPQKTSLKEGCIVNNIYAQQTDRTFMLCYP